MRKRSVDDRRYRDREVGGGFAGEDQAVWKSALLYGIGILALIATVILAWFFPGWYSQWQDQQLTGKVTVSSRDKIEFIDTETLDIAGRLWRLKNVKNVLGWGSASTQGSDELVKNVTRVTQLQKRWAEANLLPAGEWTKQLSKEMQWIEDGMLKKILDENTDIDSFGTDSEAIGKWLDSYAEITAIDFYFDQGTIPAWFVKLTDPDRTIIMDREKDIIYYMSVSGTEEVWDGMAGFLGYSSYTKLVKTYWNGELKLEDMRDCSESDFAAVCGALSAEAEYAAAEDVIGGICPLNLDVSLEYETFRANAFRRIVSNDSGFGIAVMFGNRCWLEALNDFLLSSGKGEYMDSFWLWLERPMGIRENPEVYSYSEDVVWGEE